LSNIKIPAEIWCRTCGYFRPIANQNKGKAEEFRERVNLKVPSHEVLSSQVKRSIS